MRHDEQQTVLISDSTYALSIPNRATSNLENDLNVMIRYQIQEYYLSGQDCTKPVTLYIDIKRMAQEKGVNWRTLSRNIDKTIESVKKLPLNETVSYYDEAGKQIEDTLYLLDRIRNNKTDHIVEVQVGRSYTEYLINKLITAPELQTDPHFFLTASSQYLLPFTQWLTGRIAIERKENPNKYPYEIYTTLDEIQKAVPSGTELTASNYRKKIIEPSIEEINNNNYSQLKILNPDVDDFQKKRGRSISGFYFRVALRERTEINNVPLFSNGSNAEPLGPNNTPPWHYLASKLNELGYGGTNDKTSQKRIESLHGNPMKVWKALLYTWVQLEGLFEKPDQKVLNKGGYFQTIYEKGALPQRIDELARQVCLKAPYFADDTVRAAAGMPNMAPVATNENSYEETKQTEDNNEFLRDFKQKYGHLPGRMENDHTSNVKKIADK